MHENKLKHMEFIQNIITRMNSNSFLIKGWSVTLVSALFALAADKANTNFVLVAYAPVFVFWILDAYFLSQERQYRALYRKVAANVAGPVDFDLDASSFNIADNRWAMTAFSTTLLVFHSTLMGVVIAVMFLLPHLSK